MVMTDGLDVVGIGNAIVDVITHADDAFIVENRLTKGAMTLVDADQATTLYAKMGPGIEMSGGSAANTIAGLASLGGQAGYVGKVCDDELGEVFRHDIRAIGVRYDTVPIVGEPPTARCLIVVTPDAQRTMHTFLGASVELGPEDIDAELVAAGRIVYLEGYLWDRPKAKDAFLKAAAIAHDAGRQVALTLSDGFCVERHRDSFRDLIDGHIDLLFANEDELRSLYQTEALGDALAAVRGAVGMVAITCGAQGSLVLDGVNSFEVPAHPVDRVVDTTGAGDLYAAGFLYGLSVGRHPADCGVLGSLAAAEIISHYGGRPEVDLAELVKANGV